MATTDNHSDQGDTFQGQAAAELRPNEPQDIVETTAEIIEELLGMLGDSWDEMDRLNRRIAELEGQLAQCAEAAVRATQPAATDPAEPARLDGVLIVDDSKVLQLRLKSIIEQLGYNIVGIAEDGQSGARMALARHPKLVILDYNMPVMDGLECLKLIRSQRRDIKVIICSATITAEMSRELAGFGVDAMLAKPIQFNRFIETVKELMNTPDAESGANG